MIDGEEHVNEMFSSMGNGFTFELETLIFYSVARTCAYFRGISGVISVYGDDIICPSMLADDLTWVLEYLGFTVNTEKSFVSGPFRESCGGHYHNGVDVTPFYLRKPIETLVDLIHVANAIRLWSDRLGLGVLDPVLRDTWTWLQSHIPENLWGGHELSSTHQLVTRDAPHKRLVPMVHTMDFEKTPERVRIGTYVHWLNTTMRRTKRGEAVITSTISKTGTRFRIRSAPKGSSIYSITPFLEEV
jgi:hypothetical protein